MRADWRNHQTDKYDRITFFWARFILAHNSSWTRIASFIHFLDFIFHKWNEYVFSFFYIVMSNFVIYDMVFFPVLILALVFWAIALYVYIADAWTTQTTYTFFFQFLAVNHLKYSLMWRVVSHKVIKRNATLEAVAAEGKSTPAMTTTY